MREWVGPEVELCFDFHGKMTPGLAIEVCHELKGMRPMFVEEPVPQENVDALKLVSDAVSFPIATGERLLSRWEFREILEKLAVSYIQPDCSHAGGITELMKIANMFPNEKKTESFSFKLQIFISSLIAFSEKNFAIGPVPVNLPLSFDMPM